MIWETLNLSNELRGTHFSLWAHHRKSLWNRKSVFLLSPVPLCSSSLPSGQWAGSGDLLSQEEEDGGLWAAVRQPGRGRLLLLHLLLPALHPLLFPPRMAGRKRHMRLLRPWLLHLRPVRNVYHHGHQHHPLPEDVLQPGLRWGWLLSITHLKDLDGAYRDVDSGLKDSFFHSSRDVCVVIQLFYLLQSQGRETHFKLTLGAKHCDHQQGLFFFTAVWLEGANIRIACTVWLVAAVWSSFPLLGWGEYVPEPYGLSCTIAWRGYHTSAKDAFYVICSFACFTLVPVLFIVVSQCRIIYKVSRFSDSLSARGIHNNLRYAEKRLSMVGELSLKTICC